MKLLLYFTKVFPIHNLSYSGLIRNVCSGIVQVAKTSVLVGSTISSKLFSNAVEVLDYMNTAAIF